MCPAPALQEREERRRRDEIRSERRRERERERRLETRDGHGPAKKSKLTRDRWVRRRSSGTVAAAWWQCCHQHVREQLAGGRSRVRRVRSLGVATSS